MIYFAKQLCTFTSIIIQTNILTFKYHRFGTSLAVGWLTLGASTAGGVGSIPGLGTKIPGATRHGHKYIHTYVHTYIYTYHRFTDTSKEDRN